MKAYFKKFILHSLIFALALLSGCAEDNSVPSSSAKTEEGSFYSEAITGGEIIASEETVTGEEAITSRGNITSEKTVIGAEVTTKEEVSSSNAQFISSADSLASENKSSDNSSSALDTEIKLPKVDFKAIWISYYEFPFWGSDEQQARQKFDDMMKNVKMQGYTAVFCHVRANADAFYPSNYFPYAMQLTGQAGKDPGYDPLEIMIWAAKNYGLEFHAWINPYRVSNTTNNPDELAEGHIAKEWLADQSNRAVVHENGIYFNPSSTDVQRLILNGIREILENYDVDGIHFDDYFYPENISKDFDAKQYKSYKSSAAKPLSLANWRRANVNALVSAVYRLCHSKNKVFGISPAANISLDNSHDNYKLLYADTALWMRQEGFIDYILPQLYFGYEHPVEKSRYDYLLNIWARLPKHKNLKFYVGLGAYRMNEDSDDMAEWHNDATLMARQTTDALLKGADGIAVFSYTASTLDNPHNALQIKNMFEVFK